MWADPGDLSLLFLAGLAGGIIAGMLGIGGGIIYVLIFTSYLKEVSGDSLAPDMLVKLTIANSAFALIFAGASGSLKQYRAGNFFSRPVLIIGAAGIAGAVLVTFALASTNLYGKQAFGIAFSILLLPVILKMVFAGEPVREPSPVERHPLFLGILGLITGVGTALSGLGGGFMVIPVMNGIMRVPIKKTISISLGVITLISFGLSIFNLFIPDYSAYGIKGLIGSILIPMVAPVVVGVTLGAPAGVFFATRIPAFLLRILFLSFTALTIFWLFIDAL